MSKIVKIKPQKYERCVLTCPDCDEPLEILVKDLSENTEYLGYGCPYCDYEVLFADFEDE